MRVFISFALAILFLFCGNISFAQQGCTDPLADNFDASATTDDGSCTYTPTPVSGVDCSADPTAVSSVRFFEGFDGDPTDVEESDIDDVSFTGDIYSGSGTSNGFWGFDFNTTGTGSTGPSAPAGGGGYIYLESSSGPYVDKTIISPPISLLGSLIDAELSYYIHMYGDDISSLGTEITIDGGVTWIPIAFLAGEYQSDEADSWIQVGLDLSPYIGNIIQVRLIGNTSGSPRGDMAVDEFQVIVCEVPVLFSCDAPGTTDILFTEEFDNATSFSGDVNNGDGTWRFDNNTTGSSNTGPSGPFSGSHYTFLEAGGGPYNAVTLISPLIDLSMTTTGIALAAGSSIELSYYIHMFGEHISTLLTEISTDGGVTWTPIDLIVGEQQTIEGDPWTQVKIDLSAYLGQMAQVRFIGSTNGQPRGDISLDLFVVTACAVQPQIDCEANVGVIIKNGPIIKN